MYHYTHTVTMAHWDKLKNLLADLSSEEREQLLVSTRETHSVLPFLKRLETEEEGAREPIIHEGRIKISQIQALIWMLQGELHFGTVDPMEGDMLRTFSNNGRDGTLPPELTFHKAFWARKQKTWHVGYPQRFVNVEVDIDNELFDRHVPRLTDMLKSWRSLENQGRIQKFKEVTTDPRIGHHPIPHEIFGEILHIMNES